MPRLFVGRAVHVEWALVDREVQLTRWMVLDVLALLRLLQVAVVAACLHSPVALVRLMMLP